MAIGKGGLSLGTMVELELIMTMRGEMRTIILMMV